MSKTRYLLDTNILSELMRMKPDHHVLDWIDNQLADELYISTITIAEIYLGIALLPEGKRKKALTQAARETMADFADNQLGFTEKSALEYADIVAKRTRAGRPISVEDAQIAVITRENHAMIVTRNINDFDLIGVDRVNPFESG